MDQVLLSDLKRLGELITQDSKNIYFHRNIFQFYIFCVYFIPEMAVSGFASLLFLLFRTEVTLIHLRPAMRAV